jgi:hypothetical protein
MAGSSKKCVGGMIIVRLYNSQEKSAFGAKIGSALGPDHITIGSRENKGMHPWLKKNPNLPVTYRNRGAAS